MHSLLPTVADQLFRDIQKTYQETSQIPDDLLIALKFIFGPCALPALDLVDQHSVTCLSSPSGRKVFQVTGGSGRLYTCFVSCHYCPCPAFAHTVLRKNEGLLCKHILAVYLCQAMGVTQQDSVTDQQVSMLLSGTSTT
ncbi:zinc finger SWIM domain-containing protein 7 [Solea senegalensis]|uniref:Zinc finger SWIM domain-containing protein 7 n=1 Tax=Solea senegalensis TaxID=28829 RepID=A0AAV6SGK4_SOLSE|nr:zinc finger SWIM domain-containing protein 7 isoform X1 [Solea senegalensis]KAG7516202.1 zinc finger SWIM domain-containing protein 7 [Solea senegalensis]